MAFDFGGAIGSAFTAAGQYFSARDTNRTNQRIAREQEGFQEHMSNTAHQREMADLKAAGLNPMLSLSQGGASTPPGVSIPAQNELGPAISSAMEAARVSAELKNMNVTNEKIQSDTALNRALKLTTEKDALLKANSAKVADAQAKIVANQLPASKVESDIDRSTFGKVVRYMGRLNPFSSSAVSLSKIFK